MRLEIGNFHVKDIVFGDQLSFRDGVLTINKETHLRCQSVHRLRPDGRRRSGESQAGDDQQLHQRSGQLPEQLRSEQSGQPCLVCHLRHHGHPHGSDRSSVCRNPEAGGSLPGDRPW